METRGQICAACHAEGKSAPKVKAITIKKETNPFEVMKKNLCILEAEQRIIARQLGQDTLLESRANTNKQLVQVSSAIEKLAGQLLKYEQAGQKAAQTMNREQQIATIARWFENLPPEDKRNLIKELTQIYNNKRSA